MKKYLTYLKTAIKVALEYRVNFALSILFDLTWFLVFFSLWTSIFRTNDFSSIQGYSLSNTITYYFITETIFRLDVMGSIYMNEQIWNGYFTNDLIKPWNVSLVNIMDAIAEKFLTIVIAIPALIVMFMVAKNYLQFESIAAALATVVVVVFAFFMNVTYNLCIHALGFKFGDQLANIELFNFAAWFLGGAFFPLDFLPGSVRFIFDLMPFRFIYAVPADLFLGKIPLSNLPIILATIMIWIVFFYALHRLIYNKGLKYYTGTGR